MHADRERNHLQNFIPKILIPLKNSMESIHTNLNLENEILWARTD